jgi:hypothetical protein
MALSAELRCVVAASGWVVIAAEEECGLIVARHSAHLSGVDVLAMLIVASGACHCGNGSAESRKANRHTVVGVREY